jgi:putative ABC transport system permease protein
MRASLRIAAEVLGSQTLRAVRRNKLRSSLTALGITIGIAAVVCVMAIGSAGSVRAEEQLQSLGDNLIWIEAGSRAPNGVRSGSHGTTTLTLEDADAIRREVKLIKNVAPNVDGALQVVAGDRNWRTHYRGVSPEYFDVKHWQFAAGGPFTEADVERLANVCVIGQTVREKLFGAADPLGRVLRIDSQLCAVTGLLAPKGQSATGQDQDDTVVMPWSTAQRKIRGRGFTWLDDILCSAVSRQAVLPAIAEVSALLRQRHHIRPGEDDDFNIRRPDEVIKAQEQTSNALALLLTSIAAISLVVGGIGVMNVMLVSVTERTREIGLRLAVGATGRWVQVQFLGEAVLLSLLGGVAGIALGIVASLVLGRVLDWRMSIPPQALLLAPLCATAVGVFFGFYPARRAARLDPIVALRHE